MGVLARLLDTVNDMTSKLDVLARRGLQDWVEELAALHALQVQAQALLDIVARIASSLGYAPTTAREAAEALKKEGLLSSDDYDFLVRVIGFRNIVVHEYADVDMELVREIVARREYARVAVLAGKLVGEASRRGLDP